MSLKRIAENIHHLFSSNARLRLVSSWLRRFIYKSKRFFFFAFLFLLVVVSIFYKLKPLYCEKIYHQAALYLVRYFSFDKHAPVKVNVSGNYRVTKEDIITIVEDVADQFIKETKNIESESDYKPLLQNIIDELKSNQPWIHQLVVSRSAPYTINVEVTEYQPFAIWQNDSKKYIIDKEGNCVSVSSEVASSEEFRDMVILSGVDANLNAKSLFNIFTVDPELSKNIYSATWVGNRRFDISFDNGLLIKLPEKNISKAWQHLIEIYKMPGSLVGLKVIDLRVEDKIYLKYDDAITKEIQKL